MRASRLLVPLLALAIIPSPAAAEPGRTLSVAPGQALSATLTLPAKGVVRLQVGSAQARIRADGDDLVVRGVDIGRNRLARTARLLVSRSGGVTTVTLGVGQMASTRAGTVRLRGPLSLRDRYASSVGDPLDRLAQRAGVLHLARPRTLAYLGQGVDGELHYREIRNWAAAFLPGLLWQVAAERGSALHARWAWEEVRDLRHVARFDDPDVGFVFWRAAGRGWELACTPGAPIALTAARCAELEALVGRAGLRLVERSAGNPLGLVPTSADPARCSQCGRDELRIIVDQLHNLPALTAGGDPARTALAHAHARWVAANLVRPDGAVYQQAFIDRLTGALTRQGNFQGLDDTSVWSRGQAWAISGLARAATALADPELLATATRAADWWLARAPLDAPPPYDFSAPPAAPRDSSALAIAGTGFDILADRCAATGACDAARYRAAADAARAALVARLETGAQLGRLGEGAYTVGALTWDENAELPWGTDFLAELLAR